jgi:hypothetical protein
MKSKHTPGPWEIKKMNRDMKVNYQPVYVLMGSDRCLCVSTTPEGDADAKLIAAAPDLLEALDFLLAVVTGANGDKQGAKKMAVTAIAKAVG